MKPHESSQIQPVYTKVHYIKIQLQKTTCSFQAEISPTHAGFCPIPAIPTEAGKSSLFHGAFLMKHGAEIMGKSSILVGGFNPSEKY